MSSVTMLGIPQEKTRYSPNPTALRTKFCIPRPSFVCRLLVTSSIVELSSCFTCKQWQGNITSVCYDPVIVQAHAVWCPCWICVTLAFVDILHYSVNLKLATKPFNYYLNNKLNKVNSKIHSTNTRKNSNLHQPSSNWAKYQRGIYYFDISL